MVIKKNKTTEILSLIFFSIITVLAIFENRISIFYIIYLFWFDEFLKTIFNFIAYKLYSKSNNIKQFIRNRFFMLGIYFIFITIMFGFVIDWKTDHAVLGNLEVIMFRNPFFNFSLLGFLMREIFLLYILKNKSLEAQHVLSKGIITLHLSILFGVFVWAFLSGKFIDINFNAGIYKSVAAIIPFFIIKIIFEIKDINNRYNASEKISKI